MLKNAVRRPSECDGSTLVVENVHSSGSGLLISCECARVRSGQCICRLVFKIIDLMRQGGKSIFFTCF